METDRQTVVTKHITNTR